MANRNYRMRAETIDDVGAFMSAAALRLSRLSVAQEDVGVFQVTFSGVSDIDAFRKIIKGIEDGHVMLRTLNYTQRYTGEQYYIEEKMPYETNHDASQSVANVRSILSAREGGESSGSGTFSEDNTDS